METRFYSQTTFGSVKPLPTFGLLEYEALNALCKENTDAMTMLIQKMPKTDLHVHAEAGFLMDIALAKKIASRNNVSFPNDLVDEKKNCWKFSGSDNLEQFVEDFKRISNLLRTPQDIEDITYAFYEYCYHNNVIFSLPGISFIQCKENMNFIEFNLAYNRGIARGIKDFGEITTLRLRYYQERHVDKNVIEEIWELIKKYPNPMITTIGLAGAEEGFPLEKYFNFFSSINEFRRQANTPWFFITAHIEPDASENTLTFAKDYLDWFAHGRNVADYPDLQQTLIKDGMTLEICPLSDVAFFPKSIPNLQSHYQFQRLCEKKMISLNSDDPAFCGKIDEVYQQTYKELHYDLSLLYQCTFNGLFPAKPNTLQNMQWYSPEAYHEHVFMIKHNMLKLKFFEKYCCLIQEIVKLENVPIEIKKQLVDIQLNTSVNELKSLSTTLKELGVETNLKKLVEIKEKIIRTGELLKIKTLESIEKFEHDYGMDQPQPTFKHGRC